MSGDNPGWIFLAALNTPGKASPVIALQIIGTDWADRILPHLAHSRQRWRKPCCYNSP